MSDFDQLQSAPDDPVLDRYLRSLPRFAPRTGFEDRVLARVRKPLPMRVRRARESVVAWAKPARLWWATGLAAASSAAWTLGLAGWLSGTDLQAAGARLATAMGLPAWNAALAWLALGGRLITAWALGAYQLFGPQAFAGAGALMAVPALSAVGLYLVSRQPRRQRVRAYAAR